jgi:hypothetical protein
MADGSITPGRRVVVATLLYALSLPGIVLISGAVVGF